MAGAAIASVEVERLDEVQRAFAKQPPFYAKPFSDGLHDLGEKGRVAVQGFAPRATGRLSEATSYSVDASAMPLWVEIKNDAESATDGYRYGYAWNSGSARRWQKHHGWFDRAKSEAINTVGAALGRIASAIEAAWDKA
jgi:hypothetical protein